MADANTQYVIDVAAKLSGGSATAAELNAVAAELSGAGRNAAALEDASAELSGALEVARAASAAAAGALAEGRQQFRELEVAAQKAAVAEERAAARSAAAAERSAAATAAAAADPGNERLAKSAERAAAAATRAAASHDRARSASAAASAAAREYAGELEQLQSAAQGAAAAQRSAAEAASNMSRVAARVRDNLGDASTDLATFRGALGDVGGPVGELGERLLYPAQALVDLRERFGTAAAAGTVAGVGFTAVAAAVVALDVALVAAVASLAAMAVGLGNAARSARLTAEAMARVHPELRAVSGGMRELTDATGVAAPRLQELALQLSDASVTAAELPAALRAAALAEAALGQGGAQQFIADLNSGKMSVREFADVAQRAFGDIVPRQLLSLEAQSARFRVNVARLFDGLDIEPALFGLQWLVRMFDESTATGRAMRMALTGLLQPLIDNAENAALVIRAFVLGVAIGLTKIYIAVKPGLDAVAELFGFSNLSLRDVLDATLKAGELFAPVLLGMAAALGIATAAIGFLAAALLGPVAAIAAFVGIVAAGSVFLIAEFTRLARAAYDSMAALVATVYDGAAQAVAALFEFAGQAASAGASLVQGFVQGVRASAGAAVAAVRDMAQGALNAARATLGIQSPSTELRDVGEMAGAGMTGGVESATPAVQDAMSNMVAAPRGIPTNDNIVLGGGQSGGAAPGGALIAGAGGGPSVTIGEIHIHTNGTAEDEEARFAEILLLAIEGDVAALARLAAA